MKRIEENMVSHHYVQQVPAKVSCIHLSPFQYFESIVTTTIILLFLCYLGGCSSKIFESFKKAIYR